MSISLKWLSNTVLILLGGLFIPGITFSSYPIPAVSGLALAFIVSLIEPVFFEGDREFTKTKFFFTNICVCIPLSLIAAAIIPELTATGFVPGVVLGGALATLNTFLNNDYFKENPDQRDLNLS